MPEAARTDDLFPGRRNVHHRKASLPAQFAHGFLHHHAETVAYALNVEIAQLLHRCDAAQLQLLVEFAPHAPHFAHGNAGKNLVQLRCRHRAQIAHPAVFGALLRHMVGQLGQRLGRRKAHTHRQAQPLLDTLPYLLPIMREVSVVACHIQKAFIDAVNLLPRAELAQHRHHAVGHVRIQGVIRRQRNDAVLARKILQFKPRPPHSNAERLDLAAARHHAAIVIGQHHHTAPLQLGIKHALGADVEIVDVD